MGMPNVMNIGRSGMMAAKASISTAGHNIANSNVEGYSRQRVEQAAQVPQNSTGSGALLGQGVNISKVSRINDEYIEKQLRDGGKTLANSEEKDMVLKQTEDVFNEMNGDGLNRLMSRFFNEFRKLANEPDSEAVRQSVREASQAVVNDFHRIRKEVDSVRSHIDSRIEGHVTEINSLANEVKNLNIKIKTLEMGGAPANDLQDKRDQALKQLASYMDLNMHKDNEGNYVINVRGVGPLVSGSEVQKFEVQRSPADEFGKPENALDVIGGSSVTGNLTHQLKGGRLGALIETRDQMLSSVLERLDELAHNMVDSVNQIHRQGFTRDGVQNVNFFKPIDQKHRAAEFLELSDAVKASVNNISAAAMPDSPGDNRIAIALSGIQNMRTLNGGKTTMDDFYNSIMSDVGVAAARNRSGMNQQKDIITQLSKMRDQVSGVSIDEETTNLMQFQHAFDASARVIRVADEMLRTVLSLKS